MVSLTIFLKKCSGQNTHGISNRKSLKVGSIEESIYRSRFAAGLSLVFMRVHRIEVAE
jgi:hypothetical protein